MLHQVKSCPGHRLLGSLNEMVTFRILSLMNPINYQISDPQIISISKRTKHTMIAKRINLTSSEARLRSLLLDVAKVVDESNEFKDKLILRFAGGWVRDKLLGIPSNDIDVAVNVVTGTRFTSEVWNYLQKNAHLEKHHLNAQDFGRFYMTVANPEKSKHLETSTMTVMGYDVDFVNLRKETYTGESRNPQMEFGTPEEDALRRDATINSIFYNIHTEEIEDYTGGLNDLAAKRIRTPIDPKTTFLDDPLRVLRLIRFANRLNFEIERECEVFMHDAEVLDAFQRKISRERVLSEIMKMLKGQNPYAALRIFDRLGLYFNIFVDTASTESAPTPDITNWKIAYGCLQEMISTSSLSCILEESDYDTCWLLAAYTPWSSVKERPQYVGKAKLAWGGYMAREALKLENKKISLISGSLKHCRDIINLKDAIIKGSSEIYRRDYVANLIRGWDLQGKWQLQVIFSILVEAMNSEYSEDMSRVYQRNFRSWDKFIDHLEDLKLMNAPSIKNLVDGEALMEALDLKAGKWVAQTLKFCMDWTLRYPDANDPREVIEEVQKRRLELGIPTCVSNKADRKSVV